MKKYLFATVFALTTFGSNAEPNAQLTDALLQSMYQINKSAPITTKDGVRLDGAMLDGHTLVYRYTLPYPESQFPDKTLVKSQLSPIAKLAACKDKAMKMLMDLGADFKFFYYSQEGERIVNIKINNSDCQ